MATGSMTVSAGTEWACRHTEERPTWTGRPPALHVQGSHRSAHPASNNQTVHALLPSHLDQTAHLDRLGHGGTRGVLGEEPRHPICTSRDEVAARQELDAPHATRVRHGLRLQREAQDSKEGCISPWKRPGRCLLRTPAP